MKAAYKEPDYESIFRENEGKPLKTLIAIYQGKYVKLFWSVVFFLIKDSPSWISPLVMAAMIDIITKPGEDAVKKIILNSVFIILLTVQNVPTSYIHVYFYAKTIRQVEKELRCALVRKLQQLSISYHTQMESGRLQSKVMRDVEQIENLSSQIFITVLYIVVNIVAALVIVITKSKIVFGFFLAAVPVAVLLMLYFREKVKNYNTAFRKEMEETTVSVVEMMEMIPVAKAHALERRELNKMEKRLVKVADKGFRLDMIQTYFGAWSWVVFQVFRVFCLIFTAFMALNKKISIGDVAMYQSYFGTVVGCIAGIVGLVPVVTKGLESVTSISGMAPDTPCAQWVLPESGNSSFPALVSAPATSSKSKDLRGTGSKKQTPWLGQRKFPQPRPRSSPTSSTHGTTKTGFAHARMPTPTAAPCRFTRFTQAPGSRIWVTAVWLMSSSPTSRRWVSPTSNSCLLLSTPSVGLGATKSLPITHRPHAMALPMISVTLWTVSTKKVSE